MTGKNRFQYPSLLLSKWMLRHFASGSQILEFVAETILTEMKIKNPEKNIFRRGEKSTSILFFCEN